MPSHETFTIPAIRRMVKHYLRDSQVSIDPFARNNDWATHTNDLNPNTDAQFHLDAEAFLETLINKGVKADCIIFDPPYSLRQVKECYENVGRKFLQTDAQNAGHWAKEKNLCAELLEPNGVFLHFGWHSNGIGEKRGFAIERILLVAHGRAHHDTICTVERKLETFQIPLPMLA